jgi:hypothetical protein
MWVLHFLPDSFIQFVVHTILIAGVVGCVISFFALKYVPFITGYKRIAQIVSAVLLVSGIYFEGGYSTEMQWRERVREMEAKVAKAVSESKAANDQLNKKSAERARLIQGRQIVVKQYIDREVAKYNDQCVIPKTFVDAHNQSAEPPK